MYILTSQCASHHNGVHFLNIATSKSAPNMVCFVHFEFQMCFAPQRRALFQHLNFQKWSEPAVCLCILTSKCASHHNGVHLFDISTSKSAPELSALYILTWKCASHHNGVHLFDISTSKSGPNRVCLCILTSKCASRHNDVHFLNIATSKSAPNMVCFIHFDFQRCFAPQWRALFRHLNS